MEDLLDIIFTEDDGRFWITYMESEGLWVTRPMDWQHTIGREELVKVVDEYDVWSEEEEEEEED